MPSNVRNRTGDQETHSLVRAKVCKGHEARHSHEQPAAIHCHSPLNHVKLWRVLADLAEFEIADWLQILLADLLQERERN